MRSSGYAVAGLAVLVLGAAGCGGGNDNKDSSSASAPATPPTTQTQAPKASTGASTVTIGETEYKLSPAAPTTKAGVVTLTAKNNGTIVHNLEIEGNGVEKKTADAQPGSSEKLTVALKPGKYEIYCAIDGHRDLGMKGDLTVQ